MSRQKSGDYRSSKSSKSRSSESKLASRVEGLASTLESTNHNLRDVDRMLEEYRDVSNRKAASLQRLRRDVDDLEQRVGSTRKSQAPKFYYAEEDFGRASQRRPYSPTSPLHRHSNARAHSDDEYDEEMSRSSPSRLKRSSVRFFDDMDTSGHLHHLHQSVRNLSSDQLRIHDELDREVERRNRLESDHKKALSELERLKSTAGGDAPPPTGGSRVDQRLQVIQDDLKAQRLLWQHKQEEAARIASELKQAVDEEATVAAKRNDENTQALVDDLKRQLQQAEEDKKRMQSELRDGGRRHKSNGRGDEVDGEVERQQMEKELREMRSQLLAVNSQRDVDRLQQELEKSEQQRAQLSDHIQTLIKEMDGKEKQYARAMTQSHEVRDKLEECERQRHQCLVQLEDTVNRLREATHEAERYAHEVKDMQATLTESEVKRETFKNKAQDAIKQWKSKCTKLETDVERLTKSSEIATSRCDQLAKELETASSQSGTRQHQVEHMRRELNDLLAIRAQQDEMIRLREIEVNEIKSVKLELEHEVRDLRQVLTELQNESVAGKERLASLYEEKCRLEDQMTTLQSAQLMGLNQVQRLQEEVGLLNANKLELSSQLSAAVAEKRELRERLQEVLHNEAIVANQTQAAMLKIKEDREAAAKQIDALKNELIHYRNLESRQLREAGMQLKKFQAENEAEVQSLQLELKQEKVNAKSTRKLNDKMKAELETLKMELARKDEELADVQQKYEGIKMDIMAKCDATEDALFRAREAEVNTSNMQNAVVQKQKDLLNMQTVVTGEVDSLIEVACIGGTSDIKQVLNVGRDTMHDYQAWLTDTRTRFQWLRTEFTDHLQNEQRLRSQFQSVLLNAEKDGKFLLAEIERQNRVLDELANQRLVVEGKELYIAEPDLEDIHKEKEKIEQRYLRLQETIAQLRRDVTEVGRSSRLYTNQQLPRQSSLKNGNGNGSESPTRSSKRLSFASDA